jgi:carboxymethylenebutenolidase
VAWYGRVVGTPTELQPTNPVEIAEKIAVPVLGLYGGQDQGIPLATLDNMREALKRAKGKCEIHVYPDAPHAFFADYRPSYRPEAAADAWRRLLAWFRKNGLA